MGKESEDREEIRERKGHRFTARLHQSFTRILSMKHPPALPPTHQPVKRLDEVIPDSATEAAVGELSDHVAIAALQEL